MIKSILKFAGLLLLSISTDTAGLRLRWLQD